MTSHLLPFALAASLLGAPWGADKTARQAFDALDTFGAGEELATGKLSESPGEYAWGESYLLAAYVAMYEATKDTRYLDRFVSRYRVLLSLRDDKKGRRDDLRGKMMAAWGCTGYSGGKYTCWNVHAGMLTHPAARFVRLVKERKGLRKRYGKTAMEFTVALEETVGAFAGDWREGPEPDEAHYVEPALNGQHAPLNQQNALGRTLLDLGAATGERTYVEQAAKLARFFKRRLRLRPDGTCDWSYWPALKPPYEKGSEDISHAAINVDFAICCYRNKIVFTREDIQRMAATLLKVIHKGEGKFGDTVDGGGAGQYAPQIGRWGDLACVNPEVVAVLRDYFFKRDPPLGGTTTMLALATLAKYGK